MENQLDLIQWFRKMGYYSDIPESLKNLTSNKSTSSVWNELIENAKPRHEVNNLRNNVIMNRLKNKPLNKQDDFSYSIKNIMLYLKKQHLAIKLNNLNSIITEKKHLESDDSKNNKMKYITIEKVKLRIKENKIRQYMLEKKCKMLEENIQNAEETLTFAKNLTPVELDENPNTTEITETLQKCAEKLESIIREMPIHKNYSDNSMYKPLKFYSAQKPSKTQSTLEKYLIMSERKHTEKITVVKHGARSTIREKSFKENLASGRKVNKNLFCDTNQQNKRTENKRESLGILPDSYLNSSDLIFLTETNTVEEIFTSNMCIGNEMNLYDPSPKQNFDSRSSLELNGHKTHFGQMQRNIFYDKLLNNEFVTEKLSTLLYNHNRQIVWNTFKMLNDNLNLAVTKHIILESGKNEKSRFDKEDIAKLQFLHIQTELQVLKLKAILKDLLSKIVKKKKLYYATINNRGLTADQIEDAGRLFETQLYDICLDVTLAEMKKEINSEKKTENNNDIHITFGRISQIKEDICQKIETLRQYVSDTFDTLQSTAATREIATACVRKLGPFVEDLTWAVPLTSNLCSTELRAFEKFPLEYNRRCIYTNQKTYYKDIMDDFPRDADLDDNTLYMLTNILENPFSPPETIALHILKCKMKLNSLKFLPKYTKCDSYKKYSLKELQALESYLQYALDRLNSLIFSPSANKTLGTMECVKSVMKIWLEMPMKEFISDKRTVNGYDYKFYEKQYDSFYNNI